MTEMLIRTNTPHPTVDIVVPVYNEARGLERSIRRLRTYLDDTFPFDAKVTIADNASSDNTWNVALRLEAELAGVRAIHLDQKGRGRALRTAWTNSDAEIVAYMDVDLSTDLDALLPLVAPLISGHSEVAIGSRLARSAHVIRGPKRELISRCYNLLLRVLLHNMFTDAQCGFKAMRASEARQILPAVKDNEWFFDTELLVLAERNGLRIHEVPVDWVDDPDSRVRIGHTALADLKGISRLMRSFACGGGYVEALEAHLVVDNLAELARFAGTSLLSPVTYLMTYLIAYLALRSETNPFVANLVALTISETSRLISRRLATIRNRRTMFPTGATALATMNYCVSIVLTTWCLDAAISIDRRSSSLQIAALLTGVALTKFFRFVALQASAFRIHLREGTSCEAPNSSAPEQHTVDALCDRMPNPVRDISLTSTSTKEHD